MASNQSMVHLYPGALHELESIAASVPDRLVLFVVDPTAYAASGAEAIVEPILASRRVVRFSQFELNPKLDDVQRGIEALDGQRPDLVIALGGGTAIDLGKLIGALSVQPDKAVDVVTGQAKLSEPIPPLVAIPTTAGTGSEATHFAVAYVGPTKHSVADPRLLPDYAIVDPSLTDSLPPEITTATGLDALCQAIESIWAVGATSESERFASEACRLAVDNLQIAALSPTKEARLAMCRASHLAGQAINISKTTACHAISYSLTSRHGFPHGIAVAMTLTAVLAYNAEVTEKDCNDPRGPDDVRSRIDRIVHLLGTRNVPEACEKLETLLFNLGCPRSIAEAGISGNEQVTKIVDSVNVERMSNNPRQTTAASLATLLKKPHHGLGVR
ncbi:phosphonoacetaldehyde reductase [Roseiconus nitratireducens]|uniref:Phosphonoacetaldehyde reductase n=1 Tax=Roseiconus nitratireducens TaxID=2605748 RepID=A0A5M6CUK7_9BACT|nr:phosphonoacetaldehyde reductase [Roseiconus nitratireducens]KAA5538881.1 phosphonoacetaldehyde reductase [Roseiconus nitratireducens]